MKYSIVIPVHNGERYLSIALASTLKQTRKADEIIVLDDASQDRTAEIAQSAAFKNNVMYVYNDRPTGFVDSWNRAISLASGDYVTILHQDDLLHPGYLSAIEIACHQYPKARHFYAACTYIDDAGQSIKSPAGPYSLVPVLYSGAQYARNYLAGMTTNNHIHRCPGVTTSRDLLLHQCTYRRDAGHIADDDFFLRVGAFTDVVGISQPLASYRHHALSVTSRAASLTSSLARDYVFQVRFHKNNRTLLDADDITKLEHQAIRFINLLLFESLLQNREPLKMNAVRLRDEFEIISPSFMKTHAPAWSKILWRFSTNGNGRLNLAALYAKSLHALITFRDVLLRRGSH